MGWCEQRTAASLLFSLALVPLGSPSAQSGSLRWQHGQLAASSAHTVRLPNTSSSVQVPLLLHRSHKHSASILQQLVQTGCPAAQHSMVKEQRLCRNLQSCARMNPDAEQRYYDDIGLVRTVEDEFLPQLRSKASGLLYSEITHAWRRLREHHVLRQVVVLQADLFRLAVVWLYGGWWADADVRCIDSIAQTFQSHGMVAELQAAATRAADTCAAHGCDTKPQVGCALAWEGEVSNPPASPLNWAFGCAAQHPLMLTAIAHAASLINSWSPYDSPRTALEFTAAVQSMGRKYHVDVLQLTGPAMFTEAVGLLAKQWGVHHTLTQLRHDVTKESDSDKGTWDRATILPSGGSGEKTVLILPYCFFRSRGCGHLVEKFHDRVLFHHEFETSWRQSFWHNYYDENADS